MNEDKQKKISPMISQGFALTAVIVFLLMIECNAQDVRQLTWGITKDAVKTKEGKHEYKENTTSDGFTYIAYSGYIADKPATICFYFTKNKLFTVKYIFTKYHTNSNKYVDDFYDIDVLLDKKYGTVQIEKSFLDEKLKGSSLDLWGEILLKGLMTISSTRSTTKTRVDHILMESDGTIIHTIEYISIALIKNAVGDAKKPIDDL